MPWAFIRGTIFIDFQNNDGGCCGGCGGGGGGSGGFPPGTFHMTPPPPIHPVPMGPPMGPGPPPFPMAPPGSTMGPGSTTVAGAKLLVSRRVFVLLKYEQQQVDNHHLKPLKPYHVKFKTPQKRRGPVAAHPENMSTSWRSGIFHCQVDPSSTRLANGQVRSGDVFWCLWMLHDS